VNQRDVDLVMDDLISREISDFREMWDDSSSPERAALAALVSLRGARGMATVQEVGTILSKAGARVQPEQVADALEGLADRGILERLGALSYRFRVALLRDWLSERIDLDEVVSRTRWDDATPARADSAGVVKLSTRRSHRKERRSRVKQDAERGEGDGQEDASPGGLPWIWLGAAAALALVLVVVAGPPIFRALGPEPTPTATLPPSATVRLATATLTATAPSTDPVVTTVPLAVASPTSTPLPAPTVTPTPTPPIVVSRSVPAIAYQSRQQGEDTWYIYLMSSDGSDRLRLSQGQSEFLSAPAWSPDGTRLAFASDQAGNTDIWVADIDGGDPVNITNNDAKDHSPAWSPDGEWIAFASVRDSLYWELYLMRPDGSDVQRLTWWEDASDLSPSWSPDSTRLAFASKRDGNWEIYTMDRNGDNLVRLTNDPADDTNPAWSPDGSRIAFASTRDGYAEIYVTTVLGGGASNVSNAPYSSEFGPTWSPDGGRLAFYSDRDGDWNIHVMGSDGSEPMQLTSSNSNDQVPAWRP
jgi:TolB protein